MMKHSNLNIIFVDKDDLAQIAENPVAIVEVFEREAKKSSRFKKMDMNLL